MSSGKVYSDNFDIIVKNLAELGPKGIKKFEKTVDQTAQYIQKKLLENIAVDAAADGHTLKELAAMGHPYAVGEYSDINTKQVMRKGIEGKGALPHVEPLVHHQSSRGAGNSLKDHVVQIKEVKGNRAIMGAGVSEEAVEYIKYIVNGTSKMIPRPVFTYTWKNIREFCLVKVREGLTTALSSKQQSTYHKRGI